MLYPFSEPFLWLCICPSVNRLQYLFTSNAIDYWAISSYESASYSIFNMKRFTPGVDYTQFLWFLFFVCDWSRPNECPPSLVHLASLIVRGDLQENLKTSFVSLFSEAANRVIITISLLSPKSIPAAIRVPFVPHPSGFSSPFILCAFSIPWLLSPDCGQSAIGFSKGDQREKLSCTSQSHCKRSAGGT